MRHFVIVGILVIVMAILTYVGLDVAGVATQMHPIQASLQSVSIDWMWNWEIMVIAFLFALIIVPIGYSMIVFRRKKGDTSEGEHFEGNTPLEIVWTVLPLFAVLVLGYMGAYSLGEIRRVDPNAITIKVKAQQFAWTFEYPEYGIVSSELHLPVDQQVVLKMESSDVIHSFWVPEFRVKQDVVPGRVTEYRITPILVGAYKVRCAELCGASHAYMENGVIVDTKADYDAWIAEQQAIAAAFAAFIGNDFSGSITCGTSPNVHHLSKKGLCDPTDLARSTAGRTGARTAASLASAMGAMLTLLVFYFFAGTGVYFLKRQMDSYLQVAPAV